MALQAPANFNEIRERKMSEENTSENYTKFSNAFLDEIVNQIESVSELKVMIAIIRQTTGYQKKSDLISYSQLQKLTGLTPSSVSDGIKLALSHGLIDRQATGQRWIYTLKPLAPGYRLDRPTTSPRLVEPLAPGECFDEKPLAPGYTQKKGFKENIKKDKTTPLGVAAAPPKSSIIEMVDTGSYQENQPEPEPEQEPQPSKQQTYPALLPSSTSKEVREVLDAGVGGGDMNLKVTGPETRIKARDKPKVKGKEPDPNSKHPAVVIWQEIHDRFPNKFQMPDIITKVGDDPGKLAEWRECLIYYARHPRWDQTNSGKILDCFENQNYKKGENFGQREPHLAGNGPTSTSTRTFQPVPKPFKPRGSRADGGFTLEEYAEDYSGT